MLKFLDDISTSGAYFKDLKSSQKELAKVLLGEKIASMHDEKIYFNNGYICGKLMTNSFGAGFLKAPSISKQDVKIKACDMHSARCGDFVVAKLISSKHHQMHAKVVLICQRAQAFGVVQLVRIKGVYMGKCFRTGLIMQLHASQKSLAALPKDAVLAVKFAEKNEITEVLGVLSDPGVDELISLRIFNKREDFDEASITHARANASKLDAALYPKRLDLRHLPFVTIDPADAKDFDDAVFYDVGARKLWVMIADVSEYVSEFSALDSEAKRRAFSIYFAHKCVPMLPKELSEQSCSLNPGEDKLAFGFCLEYNEDFEIKNATLHEAIICSHRRFNYDEIDLSLQNREDLGELNFIHSLNIFAQKKRAQRLKNGYEFKNLELKIELENHLLKNTYFKEQSASHQLIEECMLQANKAAAAMLADRGIFRNHASPNLLKVYKMFEDLEGFGIKFKQGKSLHESIKNAQQIADEMGIRNEVDKIIIRSFKKAYYGSICSGHYALGFDRYSHFTSPIRRYSDLILHRLLKAILAKDERKFAYLCADLEAKCAHLSELEKDSEKIAKDFTRRKFARWAMQNINKRFRAMVLADDDEICAQLLDGAKGAIVWLSTPKSRAFCEIIVEITDVNLHAAKIFARACARGK